MAWYKICPVSGEYRSAMDLNLGNNQSLLARYYVVDPTHHRSDRTWSPVQKALRKECCHVKKEGEKKNTPRTHDHGSPQPMKPGVHPQELPFSLQCPIQAR